MINTLVFPASPVGNLESYIAAVNRIPMLTLAQEIRLAQEWQLAQKIEAAQQLVLAHLRVVVRVARAYRGYGLALGDLIQEGNVGLMKAVKRFDPTLGVRLVTFALHWIKAEIHEFVIRNWRIVKIATTKTQRKLFFKLRSVQQKLTNNRTEPSVATLAQSLAVAPATITDMQQRLTQYDAGVEAAYEIADTQADPAQRYEQEKGTADHQAKLHKALQALDGRSRDILHLRWLTENAKTTLRELADKYQVSIERIRQLEKSALHKLRATMLLS